MTGEFKKLRVEPYLDTVLVFFPPEATQTEVGKLGKLGTSAFPHNRVVLVPKGIEIAKMRFESVDGKPFRVVNMQKGVVTLK